MLKVLSLTLGVCIGVAIFLAGKWYLYVHNTTSPYDEMGIELNAAMPGPLNAYGCARLRKTFPQALPPYGCQAADGRNWR